MTSGNHLCVFLFSDNNKVLHYLFRLCHAAFHADNSYFKVKMSIAIKSDLSNGLFFLERCSLINETVCAYKLNYENLFAHTVAVIRLHLSKMLIFTFYKTSSTLHFDFLKSLLMSYCLCENQLMELPVKQPCYCDFRLCARGKKNLKERTV